MKIFLILLILLTSCSGYRIRNASNPLAYYGVKSVSVPMFYNKSPLAHVNWKFTNQIYKVLHEFSGLKLYTGHNKNADAVLVGIIEGDPTTRETMKTTTQEFISKDRFSSLLGDRNEFYLPKRSSIVLNLRLILIKKATILDKKLALSEFNKYLQVNKDKILFNEVIKVKGDVSRVILRGNNTSDSGVKVNYTQNKSRVENTLDAMAKTAANQFKGVVLYAF